MASLADLVCLRDGHSVPLFVLELVLACDRSGIRLEVIDGDAVATAPGRPHMIDEELIGDLRAWNPGVVAILEHMPHDRYS